MLAIEAIGTNYGTRQAARFAAWRQNVPGAKAVFGAFELEMAIVDTSSRALDKLAVGPSNEQRSNT